MSEPVDQYVITDHGLVVPFTSLASSGGPYEDKAYAAGWEMGALMALLSLHREHVHVHAQMIREQNREQAELIAAHNGYTVAFSAAGDGWLLVSLRRGDAEQLADAPTAKQA